MPRSLASNRSSSHRKHIYPRTNGSLCLGEIRNSSPAAQDDKTRRARERLRATRAAPPTLVLADRYTAIYSTGLESFSIKARAPKTHGQTNTMKARRPHRGARLLKEWALLNLIYGGRSIMRREGQVHHHKSQHEPQNTPTSHERAQMGRRNVRGLDLHTRTYIRARTHTKNATPHRCEDKDGEEGAGGCGNTQTRHCIINA